jgi:hypothetical protein
MTDQSETLFAVGATYHVLRDETALRDEFRERERLLYWRHAYSFYDGMHGWFFFDGDGHVRAWDQPEVSAKARDQLFALADEPTALVLACARGDSAVARDAIATIAPGVGVRRIAFEAACRSASPDCLRLIISVPAVDEEERWIFLHEAARFGFTEGVRVLLEAGVPVNSVDSHGQTALLAAAVAGALDTVELLLSCGADRTMRTSAGHTAEEMAFSFGQVAVVRRLQA